MNLCYAFSNDSSCYIASKLYALSPPLGLENNCPLREYSIKIYVSWAIRHFLLWKLVHAESQLALIPSPVLNMVFITNWLKLQD